MNEMSFIVWMSPILFILHDFEEMIMVSAWKKRHSAKLAQMKKGPFAHFGDSGSFAIGVLEELIILLGVSIISYLTGSYELWLGLFFCTFVHFFLHLKLCLQFKGYVPGITTSLVFTPLYIFFLYQSIILENYSFLHFVLSCLLGLIIGFSNLLLLIHILPSWHAKMMQYSRP